MTKSKCAVRGLVQPNAMCGHLIVSGFFCAYKGSCQHQQSQSAAINEPDNARHAKPAANGDAK